jgi:hypothetical protein
MALYSHLPHKCFTERPADGTDSGIYGQDRPDWVARLSNVRCRLVIKEQKKVVDTEHEGAVISTYKLMVLARTDLKHGDRITQVVADDGTTWGPFAVEEVLPRRSRRTHHITFTLERVIPRPI